MTSRHHNSDEAEIALVRTIGRLAQMVIELRDEYIDDPREDSLSQIERRLDELAGLGAQLKALRAANA